MSIAEWDKEAPKPETWAELFRVLKPGAFFLAFSSPQFYHKIVTNIEDAGFWIKDMLFWVVTTKMAKRNALKPAHEPIMVAQKPYKGSLAANLKAWGTGALNIEQARVPWSGEPPKGWIKGGHKRRAFGGQVAKAKDQENEREDANPNGRYPSNVVGLLDNEEHQKYFYAPRVTRKDRGEYNDHPTPKPVDLMRWMVDIYAPAGGLVIDPFMGSGSTGIAVLESKRNFIGIDLDDHYVEIARKRIDDYFGVLTV